MAFIEVNAHRRGALLSGLRKYCGGYVGGAKKLVYADVLIGGDSAQL